jgi:hypothetical protein
MPLIPVRNDASFTETVSLDGKPYDLTFVWNQREESWQLTIGFEAVTLISGVKIVPSWELINRFANSNLPPGLILVIDTAIKYTRPVKEDLGVRLKIFYVPQGTEI